MSRARGSILGDNSSVGDASSAPKTSKVFEKFNAMLHGGVVDDSAEGDDDDGANDAGECSFVCVFVCVCFVSWAL